MQRIKIPGGGLDANQLETIADLAEEYSDDIAHVTTRQDFQLHYIHIDDTPSLMRRLAAANITTREACGNSVRNVTACPYAGTCRDEVFDVTPYSRALSKFLLGHPDCQNLGENSNRRSVGARSMRAASRVCMTSVLLPVPATQMAWRSAQFRDVRRRRPRHCPVSAKLLDSFVPAEEILPLTQAIARVFARLEKKKNRNRARIEIPGAGLGIEKFKELVGRSARR